MVSKFKVGDKVKVRKKYRIHPEHVYGVIEMDCGRGIYKVRMTIRYGWSPDDYWTYYEDGCWTYYEMELKHCEPEQSPDPVREHPTLDEVVSGVQGQDVQLTLTRGEAETLALILSYIEGKGTGRGRMGSLGSKLHEAGVNCAKDVEVQHYREPKDPRSCPGLRLVDVS